MNTIIILAIFGYIMYVLLVRPLIISVKYGTDKEGISLPSHFDNITLFEELQVKGFSYPDLKNIRHNEHGQVVIEGKYTSHALIIKDNSVYVDRGIKGGSQKRANCILEARVIGGYLSKLFNPTAPIDAYKQYKSFKKRRRQPIIVTAVLFASYLIFASLTAGEDIASQFSSNNINASYLSEYSSKITIGDAFNKFFGNPKWKSYEQGIQKYVDFQGNCTLNNVQAVAVITFSLSGEKFRVESVKIDNNPLNGSEIQSLLQNVFAEE